MSPISALSNAEIVFLDFDGVIKESVEVKARAFVSLFRHMPSSFQERVLKHHLAHGGVSRYAKIKEYLSWITASVTEESVNELASEFSSIIITEVLKSPYVPGALEFINAFSSQKKLILLTATPHDEICAILDSLGITSSFFSVYGYPSSKSESIRFELERLDVSPMSSVLFGDSSQDLRAATSCAVPFVLRVTPYNNPLRESYDLTCIRDFEELL